MSKPKLVYFRKEDVYSRGETLRLFIDYYGLDIDRIDIRKPLSQDDIKNYKLTYEQVPVLLIGDESIPQSGSIMRYLTTLAPGCKPEDPIQQAVVDSIYEQGQDFLVLTPLINRLTGKAFTTYYKQQKEVLPKKLQGLANQLGDKKYFMGDQIYYCDFNVFFALSLTKKTFPEILDKFDKLKQFYCRFLEIPSVKAYTQSRPPSKDITYLICEAKIPE